MQHFKVILRVSATALTTLLGTVEKAAGISLEGISPMANGEAPVKRILRYRDGIKDKGIKGVDLLLKLLAGGKGRTPAEIQDEFIKSGFGENTSHATVSKAVADGLAARKDGKIFIVPKKNV